MKIQYIAYSKYNTKTLDADYSTHSSFTSLDVYDVCVIDLSDKGAWAINYEGAIKPSNYRDFNSLQTSVEKSKTAKILFVFPKNLSIYSKYDCRCLKDQIFNLIKGLTQILPSGIGPQFDLFYEQNATEIGGCFANSDFCFELTPSSHLKAITFSKGSKKITTSLLDDRYAMTTLDCCHDNTVFKALIDELFGGEQEEMPQWISNYAFYDDEEQKQLILKAEMAIAEANKTIEDAQAALRLNNHFKSILYSSGDQLVEVVFEMLEKMFGIDLSSFKDDKKEDFLFKIGDSTFIGEIKGVNQGVKNAYISQTQTHYANYVDGFEDQECNETIYKILIINHQRTKTLQERETVHEIQIKEAVRESVLIVETSTFLKLYEMYLKNTISREECIRLFKKTGLLSI